MITLVSDDGTTVVITEKGTSSTGKTIDVGYLGYFLDANRNEFVALSEGILDGEYGVLSGGDKVNGMPSRTFSYQGASIIAMNGSTQGQTVVDNEVGTLQWLPIFQIILGSYKQIPVVILTMKTILSLIRQMVHSLVVLELLAWPVERWKPPT